MWNVIEKILEMAKTLAFVVEDMKRYNAENQEIRREIKDIAVAVAKIEERLSGLEKSSARETANFREVWEKDKEILLIKLENAFLKLERRLPSPTSKEQNEEDVE